MEKELEKYSRKALMLSDNMDPTVVKIVARYQLIYSLSGLVVGLFCILGGITLFLNAIAGSISWTANLLGSETNISDAPPGAILFVVGVMIILVTRFTLKVTPK